MYLWAPMGKSSSSNTVLWDGNELVWAGNGKSFLRGVGQKFLKHPTFNKAFNRILNEYTPRKKYEIGLFLVCSYGKPYSQSFIHYNIIKQLRQFREKYFRIHQIILSNAGIIPRELEEYYPFCCYDWNPRYENKEIKQLYSNVLANKIIKYALRFGNYYKNFACYLRKDSDSYKSIKKVEKELGIQIPNLTLPKEQIPDYQLKKASLGEYTLEEDLILITPKNLAALKKGLKRLFT